MCKGIFKCKYIRTIYIPQKIIPFPFRAKATVFLGRQPLDAEALREALRLLAPQLREAVLVGVQLVLPVAHEEPGDPAEQPGKN